MGRGVIMLFELKSVFLNEGLEQQLSYELDISEIDMDGVFPFTSPVAVTAIARNRAGLVTLTLHCGYDYTRSCDRCGEPFTRRENKTFVHDLAQTLVDEGNDDYIETPDFTVELDEVVITDILLNLPQKNLCNCRKRTSAKRTARGFVPPAASISTRAAVRAAARPLTRGWRS